MNLLNTTNANTSICFNPNDSSSSDGGSSSSGTFVVGVLIAVLGSTGEQLGLTLWKLAENRVQKRRDERRKTELENEHLEDIASPLSPPESLIVQLDESEIAARANPNLSHDDLITKEAKGKGSVSPAAGADFSAVSVSSEHVADEGRSEQRGKKNSWIQDDKISSIGSTTTTNSFYMHEKTSEQSNSSKSMLPAVDKKLRQRIVLLKTWCIEKEALMCLVAVLTFAGGNGLNFVALGLIQESIVTLIGAWALVINIITAKFLLNEDLSYLDGVSVLMITVGITLSILGSQHSSTQWCESYAEIQLALEILLCLLQVHRKTNTAIQAKLCYYHDYS